MGAAVRFLLNGAAVEVADEPPTRTLLDWLREGRGLTGTKEGCAEGDCGACTVALGETDAEGRRTLRPACACILLLPMLHGREVVTVEHLSDGAGGPHPVQAALAAAHASQCGFCTPGFVMSIWTARQTEAEPPDTARLNDLLAGNLCRCTGYGPILDGARAAWAEPLPAHETAPAPPAALPGPGDELDYSAGGRRFVAPATLDRLADLAARHPDATILSGATDVGLWVTKRDFEADTILWTGRVAELRKIAEADGVLTIGAAVTYAEAHARLAALATDLGELVRRIGGAQVRALGTVGGNIANGSPIGDMAPALIALGARLALRRGDARREMPLEDFFLDYGRQDRAPGEIVAAVRVPVPDDPARLRCYKVSKRFDQDITAVLGCFDIALDGGRVAAARLAYGGLAGVPQRAARAEAALVGQPFTRPTVEAAMAALADDFAPISDMRASAGYRMTVARNLLMKCWLERTGTPLRLAGPAAAALVPA